MQPERLRERDLLLKERETPALPGSHQMAHLIVLARLAVEQGGMCSALQPFLYILSGRHIHLPAV